MSLHLERQVDQIKRRILALGAMVEEAVQSAITAIEHRDPDLAEDVLINDHKVDLAEVDIEEECLHTLALYHPVALDLRYVIAALKINNELERIGDLAVNISQQAIYLAQCPRIERIPFDLHGMTRTVRWMLGRSLDALVNVDADLAEQVKVRDEEVDEIHAGMYRCVEQAIRKDPELVQTYIYLLNVSRNLERIADHAVNIAEDVIYTAKGDITRHGRTKSLSEH
ncbi:phosphate signaling complex protein PhoU [Poriferisphaera sp. WC338]|uniref:phosphate signaling complex protein PhoU n=1 Tax=Poriferisphaera sp. WC338 TaxID=3425129 RepID=UPI003D816F4D